MARRKRRSKTRLAATPKIRGLAANPNMRIVKSALQVDGLARKLGEKGREALFRRKR